MLCSSLKFVSVLLICAIVLGVVGGGVSYLGYSESLKPVTVTSTVLGTQLHTSTLREVVPSTSTQLIVTTNIEQLSILQNRVLVLEAASLQVYCGRIYWLAIDLEAGQVHVSYEADRPIRRFWLLDEDGYATWRSIRGCSELTTHKGVMTEAYSRTFESTVNVSSSGIYYLAFLNDSRYDVTVTLNVDQGSRTEISTLTSQTTVYSTRESTSVRTETLRSTTYHTQPSTTYDAHPTGLGSLFFSGIGLLAVALIFFVSYAVKRYSRRSAQPPSPAPLSPLTPAVSQPVQEPAALKFCINCGTSLPIHATFCKKCGTRQQ